MEEIIYRPGRLDDAYPAYRIFRLAIQVVYYQYRLAETLDPPEEHVISSRWDAWQSLYAHLGSSAENFWVAEYDGNMVGYARSINRNGVRELTELFLHPKLHARGVGRELLQRVFPAEGAAHRTIIATLDPRALTLYLQSGVYPMHPLYTFYRKPEQVAWRSDLVFEDLSPDAYSLAELAEVDSKVLGYVRDQDHAWLLSDRKGIAVRRNGQMIGYGYLGETFNGPFAVLDAEDFPALLAHAETGAAKMGKDEFSVDVPMINREAIRYLLQRKFQMWQFLAYHMGDSRWGNFENYLYTAPLFFV